MSNNVKKILTITAISLALSAVNACSEDTGGSYSGYTGCVEGTKACRENVLLTCNAEGVFDETDCSASHQTCDPEQLACAGSQQGPCTEGEKHCDGNVLKVCISGGSYYDLDCTINNQVCDPDKLSCVRETKPEKCTEGSKSCSGNILKTCKSDGSYDETDCTTDGQVCDPDLLECIKEEQCAEGSKSCSGSILKICRADGTYDETDCTTNGQVCDPDALECTAEPQCTEGTKSCSGNILKTCRADGSYDELDCETSQQICDPEALECIKAPVCKPGSKKCLLEVLQICKDDGSGYDEIDCEGFDQICDIETMSCIAETHEDLCTGEHYTCDGSILTICDPDTGTSETVDCSLENKNCVDGIGCLEDLSKCNDTMNGCLEGNVLNICNHETGKMETFNCADDNKICNLTSLSCEYECESTDTVCINDTTRKVCNDHHYITEACGEAAPWCILGQCTHKETKAECIEEGKLYDEETGDCIVIDSLIGKPCHCTKNCTITITGKEFKNIFSTLAKIALGISSIKDNDNIVAPNYFPGAANITGCGDITAPEGMTVGCFTTGDITFAKNIINFIKSIPTKNIMGMVNMSDYINADMRQKIYDIADTFADGIHFTANNGYCIVGTIDIGGKLNASAYISLVGTDPLDKNKGLVKKINTGNHAKVVAGSQKAAADVVNYCPAGSTLFSYTKKSEMAKEEGLLNLNLVADIGFDMCLKACDSDDDCRKKDGYSCIELPNGVPAEGQTSDTLPKKHACFDQSNIEYFENMTNILPAT